MKISATQLLELLNKQRPTPGSPPLCALSGRELTPDTASPDHRIPVSKKGPNTIENIQIVHRDVQKAKTNFLPDEFVALCRQVADWSRR